MLNSLKNELETLLQSEVTFVNNTFSIELGENYTTSMMKSLKDTLGFVQLIDLSSSKCNKNSLMLVLANLERHKRALIHLDYDEKKISELVTIWPSSDWPIHQYIELTGKERPRDYSSLIDQSCDENLCEKFPRDFSIKEEVELSREIVEISPSSEMTQGTCRALLELADRKVTRASFTLGYNRTNFEKRVRNSSLMKTPSLIEDFLGERGIEGSFLFAHHLETLHEINVSERVMALRMVFLEISRVYNHLSVFQKLFLYLNQTTDLYQLADTLRNIEHLLCTYNKTRFGQGIIRLGGLSNDLPVGWISHCLEAMGDVQKVIALLRKNYVKSSHWMDKLKSNPMSAISALNLGLTGVNLRSSGVNYDLRKNDPIYFYNDVQFEIPLGIDGTNYDRYLVRVEEANQSLNIILQILDNLPQGETRGQFYSSLDELKESDRTAYIEKVLQGPRVKDSFSYTSLEGSNGELGMTLKLEDQKIKEFRLRTPGHMSLGAIEKHLISDDFSSFPIGIISFGVQCQEVDL